MSTTEVSATTPPHRATVVADEVDTYGTALPGLQLDVVRTGVGVGPNIVRSLCSPSAAMAAGLVQFPVLGRTHIGDDHVAVVCIFTAPPGSRWCEIDLAPGMLLVYGPGTEHTAISPSGLSYAFGLVEWDQIETLAEDLGPVTSPERGRVQAYSPRSAPQSVADVFLSMRDPVDFDSVTMDDGFEAVSRLLADERPASTQGHGRRIDSRWIVGRCVDHVDEVGSTASIPHLCRAALVSERRLRQAFVDVVGLPPIPYFRCRALNQARLRLIAADARETHVTEVALDAGFTHVGRFAKQYRNVFGEYPSATLTSATS